MTPGELRSARFRQAVFRGYDPAAVDALLEEVAAQLEAERSPVNTIRDISLPVKRGGYDMKEVDGLLGGLLGTTIVQAGPAHAHHRERTRRQRMIGWYFGLAVAVGEVSLALYLAIWTKGWHSADWVALSFVVVWPLICWRAYSMLTEDSPIGGLGPNVLITVTLILAVGVAVQFAPRISIFGRVAGGFAAATGALMMVAEARQLLMRLRRSRRLNPGASPPSTDPS